MKNLNKKRIFRYNRRIRGLTDYNQRLKLLKSGLTRAVVRKSNKNMLVQLVEYNPLGDVVKTSAKSDELKKYGFNLNTGNITAAYLTGYLAAKKAKTKEDVIVDFGLQEVQQGNRLYAAVKGLLDGGVNVRVSENVFPDESRIRGEHLSGKDAASVFDKVIKNMEGKK